MKSTGASLAKTTRPALSCVLERERLFELLDRGFERSVVWVNGPAGCGKTTLVSSFLERKRCDFLWYQMDQGDGDPATFFHYLGRAMSKRGGQTPQLTALAESRAQREGVVRRYFRALYAGFSRPFAIVFDDHQEVATQSRLHEMLDVALAEMPSGGCAIFISRSEPPRSMARLRANQDMEIVNWDDLRLTRDELASIAEMRGQALSAESREKLHERTEGWAAGLILILEHEKLVGSTRDPVGGSTPPVVFDYLAGEIFEKFETATRDLLVRIACVPEMTLALAEQLSGDPSAGQRLLNLARNDYFVSEKRTDDEAIYQLHPLFREFLRRRAREAFTGADHERLLRWAAALWEEADRVDDAVELLVEVEDWQGVAQTVSRHGADLLAQGRRETLMGWLEELPSPLFQANAWLLYWSGACRMPGAAREARRLFELAHERFESDDGPAPDGRVASCAGVVDSILSELDDLVLLDPWIEQLADLLSAHRGELDDEVEARAICSLLTAIALRQPEHPGFDAWAKRAYTLSSTGANVDRRLAVEPVLVASLLWSGEQTRALEILESLRHWCAEHECSGRETATLHLSQCLCQLFAGSIIPNLDNALGEAARDRDDPALAGSLLAVATALSTGDVDGAGARLERLDEHRASPRRLDRCLLRYFRGWLAALRGDNLEAYEELNAALHSAIEVGMPLLEMLCRVALAQALMECGDSRKSAAEIRKVRDAGSAERYRGLQSLALLAGGQLALGRGNRRDALEAIGEGMARARECGVIHAPCWHPASLSRLCAFALENGIEVDYARRLIDTHRLVPESSTLSVQAWPWDFKLYTLGQFRLLKQDAPLSFSSKGLGRPIELLKVLIALGGKGIRVEQIAEALWPHVDGDYAYRSFTSTLHRLRKLLAIDEAVLLQDGRLSLNPRHCWVDTWAFEQALAECEGLFRGAREKIDSDELSVLAERIMALCSGAFLADEADQPFYLALRQHFRNRYLRSAGRIAAYWEDAGDWERAADYFLRGIEADRLSEGLYRQLMLCYARHDRLAEAHDIYELCKTALATHLDIAPSAETAAALRDVEGEAGAD